MDPFVTSTVTKTEAVNRMIFVRFYFVPRCGVNAMGGDEEVPSAEVPQVSKVPSLSLELAREHNCKRFPLSAYSGSEYIAVKGSIFQSRVGQST